MKLVSNTSIIETSAQTTRVAHSRSNNPTPNPVANCFEEGFYAEQIRLYAKVTATGEALHPPWRESVTCSSALVGGPLVQVTSQQQEWRVYGLLANGFLFPHQHGVSFLGGPVVIKELPLKHPNVPAPRISMRTLASDPQEAKNKKTELDAHDSKFLTY